MPRVLGSRETAAKCVRRSVSIPLLSQFARVGGSLPEQTEDALKLNAVVAARANLCLLRNRSLGASGNEVLQLVGSLCWDAATF